MDRVRSFECRLLCDRLVYGIKETGARLLGFCWFTGICRFYLLMQYKMVLNWVHAEDWPALSDVVPTTFSSLTGYVMIMLLANAILLGFAMKKQ